MTPVKVTKLCSETLQIELNKVDVDEVVGLELTFNWSVLKMYIDTRISGILRHVYAVQYITYTQIHGC